MLRALTLCRFDINFLFDCVKLIEYFASTVSEVLSTPFVSPLPRISIINMHRWAHINSKNNSIFPMLSSGNENCERESNSIPQLLYFYLSGAVFLVSFTDPNK